MKADDKRPDQIVIRLHSLGLGNLFFQYAAARALTLKTGSELAFDITEMIGYQLEETRPDITAEELHEAVAPFSLRYQIATDETTRQLRGRTFKRGRIHRWRDRLQRILSLNPHTFYPEPRIHQYHYDFMDLTAPSYVDGTFINPRYFIEYQDVIRGETRCQAPLPDAVSSIAKSMSDTNSVSIHVRRGDYATGQTKGIYPVYGDEYVRRAIDEIENRVGAVQCFLFSDDIDWAADNILSDREVTPVSKLSDAPWIDLALMSMSKHNVIANSTFSWWGAFLNPNSEKVVVCPKVWRHDNISTDDMILDDWIAVQP